LRRLIANNLFLWAVPVSTNFILLTTFNLATLDGL